ncbi:MAG: efflux RND transporter periplasmic adaptor subunit [Magnetococcales bacterium]|nr:efflux RND transporter periplasmic adaptor subunit [Magnetococcales bacterium]
MTHLKPTPVALLLALLLLLAHPPVQAGSASSVLTVQTVTPQTQSWPVVAKANGSIAAWQESIVAAEIGGLAITQLTVDVGSIVKKGQLLVRLSQESILASRAQQRANVARAKASLAEASANAKRARTVTGTGALSAQQINQYLIAEETAHAALLAAEAALQMEEVRLHQTEIVAADAGIISARNATLGSVVQVGAELFRLVRQGRVEWRAELTAEQLLTARPGQKARLLLADGQTVEGTVRLLAPTLDSATRKAIAYVDLPANSPARPGLFAQGEIQIDSQPALVLPQTAVVWRDGNAYLFEVGAEGVVEQRKVTTGRQQGDWLEIRTGLSATAPVVATGGAFLKQGDRVQVAAPATDGQGKSP